MKRIILQTARSIGHPHIHVINSANISHSGLYSCVVENVMGSSQVVAFLGVSGGVEGGKGGGGKSFLVITLVLGLVICS